MILYFKYRIIATKQHAEQNYYRLQEKQGKVQRKLSGAANCPCVKKTKAFH